MSLILICTFLAGMTVSSLLLFLDVSDMLIRYVLAVIICYFCFFGLMRLWLEYITSSNRDESLETAEEVNDAVNDTIDTFCVDTDGVSEEAITSAAEGISDGVGSCAGEAASGFFDEGGIVLIVLGSLIVLIFGSGIYLVYEAPIIITEAAFEFILATSLIKSSKKMDSADWMGSVLKTSWKPFMMILVITIIITLISKSICPQAVKMIDVYRFCM